MLSVILTELGIAVFEEQKCIKTFPFSEPAEDYVFVKKAKSRLSDLTRFLHEKDIDVFKCGSRNYSKFLSGVVKEI